MKREPKLLDDVEGKVRIVITLVGAKHAPIKGNLCRVLTVHRSKVSEVAARVQRSVFRVIGGIEKKAAI